MISGIVIAVLLVCAYGYYRYEYPYTATQEPKFLVEQMVQPRADTNGKGIILRRWWTRHGWRYRINRPPYSAYSAYEFELNTCAR